MEYAGVMNHLVQKHDVIGCSMICTFWLAAGGISGRLNP
jgi:hypothetical protein